MSNSSKWDEMASKTGATAPEETPQKSVSARTPRTFRLSQEAISALEAAVGQAMMRGERISREAAVERAILAQYGDLTAGRD